MNTDAKSLNKFLLAEFNNTLRNSYTVAKLVSFRRCKGDLTYINLKNVIQQKNRHKDRNHMIK